MIYPFIRFLFYFNEYTYVAIKKIIFFFKAFSSFFRGLSFLDSPGILENVFLLDFFLFINQNVWFIRTLNIFVRDHFVLVFNLLPIYQFFKKLLNFNKIT